jgi:hypothetical protein
MNSLQEKMLLRENSHSMIIKPHCAIWLGRVEGNVYIDSNVTTETYKVVVHWWKPMGTSKEK